MKTKYMHKIQIGLATMVAALICTACTDTWNDHYDNSQSVNSGTLWSEISSNPKLSNFAKVIKACGYDVRLQSSQVFTVFAPIDTTFFTSTTADSLIAEYRSEKASGIKDDDNEVINQFVKNHIALYNTSVSSLTNDSLAMLNGKYITLTNRSFGASQLKSNNQLFSNGVLFKIEKPEEYFANVWETIKKNSALDSLKNFLYGFNQYEFIESKSVPGGIVDGKTVYLDSVTEFSNVILDQYGYINKEDSNYLMIMPTNTLWKNLCNEYTNYFNFDNKTNKRDSLTFTYTRQAVICDAFFNLNTQDDGFVMENASMTGGSGDTLRSTIYSKYEDLHHKFAHPFDESTGVLKGLNSLTKCSNGWCAVTDEWRIDKKASFFVPIKVETELTRSYLDSTVTSAIKPLSVRELDVTNADYYNKISDHAFLEILPSSSAVNPTVTFNVPNVLSNIGYDIYCVFVPAIVYNSKASATDRLPCKVKFNLLYNNQNGSQSTVAMKTNGSSNFFTIPDVIDTVLVGSNVIVPTTSYGLDNASVKLKVASARSGNADRAAYTNVMRLDCIIFKPHEDVVASSARKRIK
jgi:hypothetical protein